MSPSRKSYLNVRWKTKNQIYNLLRETFWITSVFIVTVNESLLILNFYLKNLKRHESHAVRLLILNCTLSIFKENQHKSHDWCI